MADNIIVKDQTIIAFYKENPNIDFITMNHIFIDILKKLSSNLNETITNNINHKILSSITDLNKDIVSFKQSIFSQLQDTKKDYIENIKLILTNNSLTANEKIQHILDKNTENIIVKTSNIMNDIIPKHHDIFYSVFDNNLKQLHETINMDTNKLIDHFQKDDKTIDDFVSNIDVKFNNLIHNLHQPIFSFMQGNEERTTGNIQQIRDKLISQQLSQERLNTELYEFLNKYKHNSSSKGNVSEYELNTILQHIFPSDEIIDCSGETATCDYKVNRLNPNKPTILFENKDYTRSVTTDEIKKFERDVKQQKHHGIFISHRSNITFKEPFQIDIVDNIIHIYLPNAEYSTEKIKIAVEIIDNLSNKLTHINSQNTTTTININKDDLDDMLELFNDFNTQKGLLVDTIRTNNKIILDKIESMQLNSIKKLLIKNGMFLNDEDFRCKFCNTFNGKNKASLGAHIRNCKSNPINLVKDNI